MKTKLYSFLVVLLVTTACTIKVDSPQIKVDPNVTLPNVKGGDLQKVGISVTPQPTTIHIDANGKSVIPSCTATVSKDVVKQDESVTVTVNASGGIAPYATANSTDYFDSSTTLTTSFKNDTTKDKKIDGTVTLRDSLGLTFVCGYSVTVAAPTVQPPILPPVIQPLSCTVFSYPDTAYQSEIFNLNVFVPSTAGVGYARIVDIQTDSSAIAYIHSRPSVLSAQLFFLTAGTYPLVVRIQDGEGHQATCSTYKTIYPAYSSQIYWYGLLY